MKRALLVVMLAGCGNSGEPPRPERCACMPTHDSVADPQHLLSALRKHVRSVRDGRNGRDIKIDDDELRLAITNACSPCQRWVDDRATIDDLFPLAKLDGATGAVCLGLVGGTGEITYGDARPAECRPRASSSSNRR